MKHARFWQACLAVATVVGLGAAPVLAQRGWCRGEGMPKYDPTTEVKLEGTVKSVEKIDCGSPRGRRGTHLTVQVDEEMVEIHLGPSDFLAENKIEFEKGDMLEFTGSRVKYMEEDVLLVHEVKKGAQSITLRNEEGIPEWAGRCRRRTQ